MLVTRKLHLFGFASKSLCALRSRVAAVAGVVTLVLAAAPAAVATSVHWYSGSLGAGYGYADPTGHSIYYVEGDADHNQICVGREQGIGGSYRASTYVGDVCIYNPPGGGRVTTTYPASCCWHGAITNINDAAFGYPSLTVTIYASTHYDY